MKIMVVTTVHAEDDTRIYYKEAMSLAQNNDVSLVSQRKTNLIFNEVNYIPLKRVESRFRRLFLQTQVLAIIQKNTPDILHFHDPELIFLALFCKQLGYKVVWDVHEDLPKQIVRKHWIKPFIRPFVAGVAQLIESFAVSRLDLVVAATPTIAAKFRNNAVVVKNYPLLSEFKVLIDRRSNSTSFVYIGGITKERGFEEAIKATELVNAKYRYEVRFDIAGKFASENYKKNLPLENKNIVYHGWLNRDEIAQLIAQAAAGLVALHPSPNHVESLPIKMFEYMASSKAIIASNFPLWREIVERYRCGILVDPMDAQSVADAMEYILEHPEEAEEMGQRGRKAIEDDLNWENEFSVLQTAYQNLFASDLKPREVES